MQQSRWTLLSLQRHNHITNNGAVLNIAHIIKNNTSSATKAKLAGLYIMAREAVYIRIILKELGHKQLPMPLQANNARADAVINGKIQPKQTKAMSMRFHWLQDCKCQQQFRIYWQPGKINLCRLLDTASSKITSPQHVQRIPHAIHCSRNVTIRTTTTETTYNCSLCSIKWRYLGHLVRVWWSRLGLTLTKEDP